MSIGSRPYGACSVASTCEKKKLSAAWKIGHNTRHLPPGANNGLKRFNPSATHFICASPRCALFHVGGILHAVHSQFPRPVPAHVHGVIDPVPAQTRGAIQSSTGTHSCIDRTRYITATRSVRLHRSHRGK